MGGGVSVFEGATKQVFDGTSRFQKLAVLGRGSMGVVYRVRDNETDTEVALKTFTHSSSEQLSRLKQEFRVLTDLVHPNLVELYELIVADSESFFTMELIDGKDFLNYLRPAGHLEIDRLLGVLPQLGDGVTALHAAGKLHRDLKPSNVMITGDGRVVLLDFGLATGFGKAGDAEYDNDAAGTLAYMAPEAVWGEAPSPAADWYSVGVMLYEAISGRLPFEGPAALLDRSSVQLVPLRTLAPDVPESLDALVTRLLDAEPSRRPTHPELAAALGLGAQTIVHLPGEGFFVGREVPLAQLTEALGKVAPDAAGIVHIAGPSGIGKSELLRRFLTQASQASPAPVVLSGRCHPQEAIPYKAFDRIIEVLARWLATSPADTLEVPADAAALARLFPVLGQLPAIAAATPLDDGAEPHEIRRRGFAALRQLLYRVSQRQPLILWIDDLQWSDADSVALLRSLLRPPNPPGMLVLLSYRSEDLASIDWLAEVAREQIAANQQMIELPPLDAADTVTLARQLCAAQVDADERLQEMIAEAHGNPFFVGELARSFSSGRKSPDLNRIILDRVQPLSDSARALLDIVSVAGNPLERAVVLKAAGVGERGRALLTSLEKRSLLRTTAVSGGVAIEMYHDRIREAVLNMLPQPTRQQRHGALADVLEQQVDQDAEALYRHSLGAGRRERAGDWAVKAADRADRALAFVRAAELYAEALQLKPWQGEQVSQLQVRRAEALVNAGCGAEAAPIFRDVAATKTGIPSFELGSRAAEQFLVTGHLEEGTEALRRSLEQLGIRHPQATAGVIAASLGQLLRLRIRGFVKPRATAPDVLDSARIDACHAAAKGFVMVDPLRGLYFATRSASFANQRGDGMRAARGLAALGAALIPAGGRLTRWGEQMIERASGVARETQDPYLLGFTAITAAQISMVNARWQEMADLCDQGTAILRQHCRGVTWEINIGATGAFRALEELGKITGIERQVRAMLRQSEERGDRYGSVVALTRQGLTLLMMGDIDEARRLTRRVGELWTPTGFHMQHFYACRTETYCDLAEGAVASAWQRVSDTWPQIEKAGILRHALMRGDAYLLRARAALALAASDGGSKDKLLQQAEADARRLERDGRPDLVAYAELLRAGIAKCRKDDSAATAHLRRARRGLRALEMELADAIAAQAESSLQGDGRCPQADAYFEREALTNPKGLVAMWAPGLS